MKRWEHGDPVGAGAVYLPDQRTREAYGQACKDKIIESWANRVVAGEDLQTRRQLLAQCPKNLVDDVKKLIDQIWRVRK